MNCKDSYCFSNIYISNPGFINFSKKTVSQVPGVDVEAEDMKCEATALFYAAMAANEKAVGRGGGQKNKKQKKKTKRQS